MTPESLICMLLSVLCATFEGLWITVYNFMFPSRLIFEPTQIPVGVGVLSLVIQPQVIVFSLEIISSSGLPNDKGLSRGPVLRRNIAGLLMSLQRLVGFVICFMNFGVHLPKPLLSTVTILVQFI